MPDAAKTQLRAAHAAYYQVVVLCIVTVVGIHGFSKQFSMEFQNPLRFYCTVAYFLALISLCITVTRPRSRYMHLLYEWRFKDCPPAIDKSWREYLHALDRAILPCALTLGSFITMTGMRVLAEAQWMPKLTALSGLYQPGWWLALVTLVVLPFAFGHRINEAMQRFRFLEEQLVTSRFQPRRRGEAALDDAVVSREPVEIHEGRSFWAGGMEWNWEDFYKSCIVLGQPGSGKTVCVLNALLDGLIGSAGTGRGQACSALILDPKGDFRGKIELLCRKRGRERDLLVINPKDARRCMHWNPLDSQDSDFEIAERLAGVMETLGMKSGDTSFWIDSAKKFVRHAITLLRLTNPPGVPPSIVDVAHLASSFTDLAARTDALDIRQQDCDHVLRFFSEEWCPMAPEMRMSIQAHIGNMLDPFLVEPYCSLFTGRSTHRISQILDRGKILYVDMPLADQPVMARTIGTFLKLEYFNEVLRRLNSPIPSLFFCDEFQAFFTYGKGKGDADFFDKSRQSNHANIIATQSITGLLKQCKQKEHAETLLGLCQVQIFLRNTDRETNSYASQLFGESIEMLGGFTGSGAGRGFAGIQGAGLGQQSQGQWGRNVRPERFAELAIPTRGEETANYTESIIHLAARATVTNQLLKQTWPIYPIER